MQTVAWVYWPEASPNVTTVALYWHGTSLPRKAPDVETEQEFGFVFSGHDAVWSDVICVMPALLGCGPTFPTQHQVRVPCSAEP